MCSVYELRKVRGEQKVSEVMLADAPESGKCDPGRV